MHSHSIDNYRHAHVFLGATHERNERKTWIVISICAAMMVAEIVGGLWVGSVALIADGLHMSTHAGALLIAALAYTYARRHATDDRLTFGTGKLGDLAAFTSAIALAMIALFIGYESVDRLLHPVLIDMTGLFGPSVLRESSLEKRLFVPKNGFRTEQIMTSLRQIEVVMDWCRSTQIACRDVGISEQVT